MAKLTPSYSKVPVDVPDALVDRYLEAGWKPVDVVPAKKQGKKSDGK